jgi:hypothetical protein
VASEQPCEVAAPVRPGLVTSDAIAHARHRLAEAEARGASPHRVDALREEFLGLVEARMRQTLDEFGA